LGGLFTVITSGSNLFAALYGVRTNFLHLPLIFLMAKVFNRDDSIKIGKWILLLSLPMAVLMIFQFNAPPDAFINRTAGIGEGQQLSSAMGRIRTPGTFSFITGVAQYFALVAAFLFYGLFEKKVYSNLLLTIAGFGLVIGLAVSGSRTAVAAVGVVVFFLLAILIIKPRLATKSYKFLLIVGVVAAGLNFIPAFSQGVEVLSSRAEVAGAHEAKTGGFVARFLSGFLEPFENIEQIPLLGHGLGMGTNAGAVLSTGKLQFLLAEGEWEKIFLESGLFLGLLFICLRILIVCWLGQLCIKSIYANNNILPLLIFGACVIDILTGQFGRPSTLGFAVFGGGLCLAACSSNLSAISKSVYKLK
jgi:hypothetical protein